MDEIQNRKSEKEKFEFDQKKRGRREEKNRIAFCFISITHLFYWNDKKKLINIDNKIENYANLFVSTQKKIRKKNWRVCVADSDFQVKHRIHPATLLLFILSFNFLHNRNQSALCNDHTTVCVCVCVCVSPSTWVFICFYFSELKSFVHSLSTPT